MRGGLGAKEATKKAMAQVAGALVAIVLVLCAVFVPTAFVEGITGEFYRQFALTIAASTIVSGLVSLTLTPALSALFLRRAERPDLFTRCYDFILGRLFSAFDRCFECAADLYGRFVRAILKWSWALLALFVALIALTVVVFRTTPKGFIPAQDTCYFYIAVQLPTARRSNARRRSCKRRKKSSAKRFPKRGNT